MKGSGFMMKKRTTFLACLLITAAMITGCSDTVKIKVDESGSSVSTTQEVTEISEETGSPDETESVSEDVTDYSSEASSEAVQLSESTGSSNGVIDTTDMFTERDLTQTPDLTDAQYIEVKDGQDIEITSEGTYVINGTAADCTILVSAPEDAKVQLVLDGVSITNENDAAILVTECDKVFVTLIGENSLAVTGTFEAVDDMNIDAVIYSKSDLVLNGSGSVNISSTANGVTTKDDLKVTGGTYNVSVTSDAFEANDSISVSDGTFNITSAKDGFHSENSDDYTVGSVYIAGGTFTINSTSDGIQGTTIVQIDGGTFDITSSEGIEGTYVQINGGTISISASDDGINAASNTTEYSVVIEINGGELTIVMGQGDTDAIDANGSIYVNGGTIDITAQMSSFDYDGEAQLNGGTVVINGTQVTEIPQSMMGGGGRIDGGGMGGMHRGGMA